MKLFTPTQQKEAVGNEVARDILRTQEVRNLLRTEQAKLAKQQADFFTMLAGQRTQWEKESKENMVAIEKLRLEVKELEKVKEGLLAPFTDAEKNKALSFANVRVAFEEAKRREDEAEDAREKLENKLDDLGKREQDIIETEKRQESRNRGIELQQEQIKKQSELLTQETAAFMALKEKEQERIETEGKELIFKERTLASQEDALLRTEKALNEWDTRLKDERAVLDANWEELRKNIPPRAGKT